MAGTAIAGTAVAATQAHPASRTRTAITRRKLINRHVARAQDDHEHLAALRAKVFPTSVMTARRFDASAAKREARKLTSGYRGQVKRVRRRKRRRRRAAVAGSAVRAGEQFCCAFPDHYAGRHGVARGDARHDGGVGDA